VQDFAVPQNFTRDYESVLHEESLEEETAVEDESGDDAIEISWQSHGLMAISWHRRQIRLRLQFLLQGILHEDISSTRFFFLIITFDQQVPSKKAMLLNLGNS
jgi:hypothetical protein